MSEVIKIWICAIFGIAFGLALSKPVQAKVAVVARAAPAPVRSYSPPVPRSTPTRAVTRTKPKPVTTYPTTVKRDDDVECSTLKRSRYAADRQVYKRYC